MATRRTLVNDLRTVHEGKAAGDTTATRIGRHRAAPGQSVQASAWNNSTTVIQTIRSALMEAGVSSAATPTRAHGPASELERRPTDLGTGLWR